MTARINNAGKIVGNAFRAVRELIGVSPTGYSYLFAVEAETIYRLEQGLLPPQLDDKLLKLLLATTTINRSSEFIRPLLEEARDCYNRPDLLEQPFPLLSLFEPVIAQLGGRYPWIKDDLVFRCRLLQLTDQANGILLWAEESHVHFRLIAALPNITPTHISLLDGETVIFIPAAYLFLKFDTSAPNNPLPALLSSRFAEGLPVGLTLPYEPFSIKSPSLAEVANTERRLFIFSPEPGSICEILGR